MIRLEPQSKDGSETQTFFKVLLISEDPRQTDLYTDLVREVADCQVDIVSRIESSFEWVAQFSYNLVVVDHQAATVILERIKRVRPVTSVILISDNATVEQAVTAMRLGAEDYLKKPINIEAFQLAVKRGLDRKAVFEVNSGASGYLNLLNSCQMISASLEQQRIFGIVRGYLSRELQSDHSAVYSFRKDVRPTDESSSPVPLAAGGELNTSYIRHEPEQSEDRLMEEILEISLLTSNVLEHLRDAQEMCRFIDRGQLHPGLFAFRFQCGEGVDYFCVCLSPKKPDDVEAFESRLRILRAQIEVTGANILQYQGVQQMVYLDDATGLYNTRYLHYILDRQIAHSQANNTSFAVLFIDADRFKAVNDQHGHLVGTGLLNELGHQLRQYVRETDTVFRYGGDEFVAVLSPCDLATGRAVAERIRSSIESFSFSQADGLNLHITVSIGVALFPEHADSKKTVINAADKAMYTAKKNSRNCVFIADLNQMVGEAAGKKSHE